MLHTDGGPSRKNVMFNLCKVIEIQTMRTVMNFEGSFIEACRLMTDPLPSKSNTATPKNNGMALKSKTLISFDSSG